MKMRQWQLMHEIFMHCIAGILVVEIEETIDIKLDKRCNNHKKYNLPLYYRCESCVNQILKREILVFCASFL